MNELSSQNRLAAAHRLGRELHEWRESLPPHLGTVKPTTLIPSFRRQAIALQLAYFHALIHAYRPFLLSDATPEAISECIFATRASLELINKVAGDSMLFHSFWWTHYVIFCALAVVYVWEIQRTTRSRDEVIDPSLGKIFDLAEKCHGHLERASTGLSQNQRYSVILDELRSEAKRCRFLRANPPNAYQGAAHGGESSANTDNGFHLFQQDPDMFGTSSEALLQEGIMLNMPDSVLFSDWQTLDSSVCMSVWSTSQQISDLVRRLFSHCLIRIPFPQHICRDSGRSMWGRAVPLFRLCEDRTSRTTLARRARIRGCQIQQANPSFLCSAALSTPLYSGFYHRTFPLLGV